MATPPAAGRGRPPGARNRRTLEFMAVLEAEGFDPAKALIECYREAKKTYDNYGTIYDAICDANKEKGEHFAPPEDNAHKYLKIAADIAKDLASYSYPKLKAIEQTKGSAIAGMTVAEKLQAARFMVKALESEVAGNDATRAD